MGIEFGSAIIKAILVDKTGSTGASGSFEWFLSGINIKKNENFWGGIDIVVNSTSRLYYPNVRSLDSFNSISFYGVSVDGLTVFVHDNDENGEILATIKIAASGGEEMGCYYKKNTALIKKGKTNNLCFTFEGNGKIDFFKFYNK